MLKSTKSVLLLAITFLSAGCGSGTDTAARDSVLAVDPDAIHEVRSAGRGSGTDTVARDFVLVSDVVPDAIQEIRYFTSYNFIGERIPGYEEPVSILTRQAADSLKAAADGLRRCGYLVKIYDAYRPQRAVDFFMDWGENLEDVRMKEIFYPDVDKRDVIPSGFVARRSGHSRGSTVDLTLVEALTGRELDMGSPFDFFGKISSPGLLPSPQTITEQQYRNRMLLRNAMLSHGFVPYENEWWHFTLRNEPFPDTFFDFPVRTESVD